MDVVNHLVERLREQEFRGETTPEIDHELEANAADAQQQTDWTDTTEGEEECRTHEPYGACCHACIARSHKPHAMGNECEKGLPCGADHRRPLVTLQ